jgi:hypothetical protein
MLISCALLNYRAVFNTGAAPGAQIHLDTARTLFDGYLEIAGFAGNTLKICVGDQFDVQMPADLDQYRGDNSHRTIIGGECFVQLGHDPADGRRFFEKVYIVSRVCQIQRTLHAGNPTADNQHGTQYILCHRFTLL